MGYLSGVDSCACVDSVFEYPILRHEEEVMMQYVCRECNAPLLCVSSTAYESRVDQTTGDVKEPIFRIRDDRHPICSVDKFHMTGWQYDVFGRLIEYPHEELIKDSVIGGRQ